MTLIEELSLNLISNQKNSFMKREPETSDKPLSPAIYLSGEIPSDGLTFETTEGLTF